MKRVQTCSFMQSLSSITCMRVLVLSPTLASPSTNLESRLWRVAAGFSGDHDHVLDWTGVICMLERSTVLSGFCCSLHSSLSVLSFSAQFLISDSIFNTSVPLSCSPTASHAILLFASALQFLTIPSIQSPTETMVSAPTSTGNSSPATPPNQRSGAAPLPADQKEALNVIQRDFRCESGERERLRSSFNFMYSGQRLASRSCPLY